jgi:hypothetical protein
MLSMQIIDITCEFDFWHAVWTNSKLLTVTVIHCCLFYSNDGLYVVRALLGKFSVFLELSQQVHIRYTDDLNKSATIKGGTLTLSTVTAYFKAVFEGTVTN